MLDWFSGSFAELVTRLIKQGLKLAEESTR